MKCLLIETIDKRKFLTHEENFSKLTEFSKIFNAEISLVKIENGNILELDELVAAICNQTETKVTFEKLPEKTTRSRTEILELASKIHNYIINQCINKKLINLKDLKNKFDNVTTAAICNHIRRAKDTLASRGYKFKKIGAGIYQVINK